MRLALFVASALVCAGSVLVGAGPAAAAECPGHPDAIGTSRTIIVDPAEHKRIGWMQYPDTLPLEDREVVLSFDDGPSSHYTPLALDALASECVKATFFMVGRMAAAAPDIVKRVYAEGHTVASHTQNHPLNMHRLPAARMKQEIDEGAASVAAALGDGKAIAPFFRIPGLDKSRAIEAHAASRGLMIWSADIDADDWTKISSHEVAKRALRQLFKRGRGLIELHDIQGRTVEALPEIFAELKKRGYRMAHVAPVRDGVAKTVASEELWRFDP